MTTKVDLVDMPAELADRVRAATAHAEYRSIARGDEAWVVGAVTGDRVVLMELALRPDGSVAERTETFLVSEVGAATVEGTAGTLELVRGGERRKLPVPPGLARRLAG